MSKAKTTEAAAEVTSEVTATATAPEVVTEVKAPEVEAAEPVKTIVKASSRTLAELDRGRAAIAGRQ
jgi:hypothetical protein